MLAEILAEVPSVARAVTGTVTPMWLAIAALALQPGFGPARHARVRTPSRHSPPRAQEPPFPLPYDVPAQPKPYSDYEWDPDYPGTFKPGMRRENAELDEVLDAWEGRDNPACLELPQDQLFQVPLAPPEDILSWLARIGLLSEELPEEEAALRRGTDSLIDDEYDLEEDDDDGAGLGVDDQLEGEADGEDAESAGPDAAADDGGFD